MSAYISDIEISGRNQNSSNGVSNFHGAETLTPPCPIGRFYFLRTLGSFTKYFKVYLRTDVSLFMCLGCFSETLTPKQTSHSGILFSCLSPSSIPVF